MKTKLSIFGLLIFLLIVISCNTNSKKKFEKLEEMTWLIGDWNKQSEEGNLIENWKKQNDSTYVGKSFFIKGSDTLHHESIELIQKEDALFYIPIVKGQNNGEPIPFKLIEDTEKSFIFKNNSHDYPQTIEYKIVNPNQMCATVSGSQDGKTTSETYILNRK